MAEHLGTQKEETLLSTSLPNLEEEQSQHDLAVLNAISWALSQSLDLDRVLEIALETTLRLMDSHAGCIHLPVETEDNLLQLQVHNGLPADLAACVQIVATDDAEIQRIITSNKVVVCERFGSASANPGGETTNPDVWVCFPLLARDRLQGLLSISLPQLTPDRARLLKTIGQHAAVAIDNAQLFRRAQQVIESERRQREITEVLHHLVVTVNSTLDIDQVLHIAVQRLQALHQATACSVSFLNDTGEHFIFRATTDPGIDVSQGITFPAANSIAGRAIQERKVQIVNDVDVSPDHRAEIARRTGIVSRSLLTAPLFTDDEPLGVIQIVSGSPHAFTQADADLLTTAAALIETAIARAQTYDRAVQLAESERRQREIAESLQEVATVINASLELDTVLTAILEQLRRVVEYDSAGVLLKDGDDLLISDGIGFPDPHVTIGQRVALASDDPAVRVFKQCHPLVLDDAQSDPAWVDVPGASQIRGWIGVPLLAGDQPIGVLTVDSIRVGTYDQRDVQVVESFANQAAIAIQNARLFQAAQKARELSDSLREIGASLASTLDPDEVLDRTLNRLRKVVPYDSASVMLMEDGLLRLKVGHGFPPECQAWLSSFVVGEDSLAYEVHRHQKPLIVPDIDQEPRWFITQGTEYIRSWLGVPLVVRDRSIGVLNLDHHQLGFYTEEHAAIASAFAAHAAIAIENAQLFEAEQRQRQMAEALHRAALALTSTMALDQVFDRILTELQHVVPYDSASVQLLKGDRLEIIGGRGFPNLSDLLGVSFPAVGNNPNTLVLGSREPIIISDVQPYYPAFHEEPHVAADIHSWLGVPLLISDRVIGMLALDKQQPDFYHEADARMAMAYAVQAAIAIENARLHQALQEYAADLESRVEIRAAEVNREHERLLAVLENAGEAIAITNSEGVIEYANPAWQKLTGYDITRVLHHKTHVLDEETFVDLLAAVRTAPRAHRVWHRELTGQRPDGTVYVVDLTITPVFDDAATLVNLVAIYRDVTQYKELDRIKSEFLSTAAHELRSPLTSILGFSELLLFRQDLSHEEQVRFLRYINDHALHLKQLVSDLLDISRIESGANFTVQLESLNLYPLFDQEIRSWQEAHPDHIYVLEEDADWPCVQADEERIGQVLRNLLSNATKYSPRGGNIIVSATPVGGLLEVTVSDEGIGMTGEELAHVFEKFWRADASSTAVEGTGLGLVIVRYIIEQHGGHIWVESTKNTGTVVHFTLPLVERETTVLIVEDEEGVREVEHRILANNGIATLLSSNGKHALEIAQTHRPDLILLDLMMPGMSGQEVLHALKANPATQHIPVIVVSARSSWHTVEESYSLGAIDFLTKPFEYQELLSRVRRALKLASNRQQAGSGHLLSIEA